MDQKSAKNLFDLTVKNLLNLNTIEDKKEQQSILLLSRFIKRTIAQFNLKNVDIYDVISEVYTRGEEKISSGEYIRNPGAWIRVTSYNVIREISRKQKKEIPVSQLINEDSSDNDSSELIDRFCFENHQKSNELDFNRLNQSLQLLDDKDRQILELKFFQNLSWKEVVNRLKSEGEIVKEATARKRGGRALERLRQAFLSVKSD
ncbi:MAG: sigma-70 family RNA polymerase sigma factor [Prochloraceae cyanobacterium]|nr:sigma-70 family RNA polymerase sigma factor [Prochloraceae cyanobacterium]